MEREATGDSAARRRTVALMADPCPTPAGRESLRNRVARRSVDWAGVLRLASENGVAATVAQRLLRWQRRGIVSLGEAADGARRVRDRAVFRELAQRRTIGRVLDGFARAGLTAPLLLKGAAAREALYPEPWLRAMDDLDLLVPARDFPAVAPALAPLGYRPRVASAARSVTEHGWHALTFVGRAEDMLRVDVHRYACRPDRFDLPPEELRARGLATTFDGRPALLPSEGDALLVTALHGAEIAGRGGLKRLVDLSLLVRRGRFSWGDVVGAARSGAASAALGAMLWLTRRATGAAPPPWVIHALGARSWRGVVLRKLVSPPSGEAFAHVRQPRWREMATLYLLPDGPPRRTRAALRYAWLRAADAIAAARTGPRDRSGPQ